MKKISFLTTFIIFFVSYLSQAQKTVTLTQTDSNQIWSIVQSALQRQGLGVAELDNSLGVLKSDYLEFNSLVTKNRIRYKVILSGSTLKLDLIDFETESTSGWATAWGSVSKKNENKFLSVLADDIVSISKNPGTLQVTTTASRETTSTSSLNSPTSITINGLTMNIISTRKIGNKILLSGTYSVTSPMEIRGMNKVTAITQMGTEMTSSSGAWAGEDTGYLAQVHQEMYSDIPISFDVMFDTKGQDVSELKLFTVTMYRPDNTVFVFRNISVPDAPQADLNRGSIEIYKDVFLSFNGHEDTGTSMKVHFTLENKSGKERRFRMDKPAIITNTGSKNNTSEIYIAGNRLISGYDLIPDIPIAGYFEFNGSLTFEAIRLLQFSTFQYADFAIKNNTFQ